jgi:hypothetical protein
VKAKVGGLLLTLGWKKKGVGAAGLARKRERGGFGPEREEGRVEGL